MSVFEGTSIYYKLSENKLCCVKRSAVWAEMGLRWYNSYEGYRRIKGTDISALICKNWLTPKDIKDNYIYIGRF